MQLSGMRLSGLYCTATKHNTNSVHNTEIMITTVTVTTTTIKQQNNDTDASVARGQKSVQ